MSEGTCFELTLTGSRGSLKKKLGNPKDYSDHVIGLLDRYFRDYPRYPLPGVSESEDIEISIRRIS